MITKGIIVSRPVESNKYSVRIPYFEEAGGSQFIAEATLSYTPGIVNSLNEGDVVFVAFEDHYKDKPTIVGKLFLTNDSSNEAGYANVQSLNVSDSATLPSNTKLGDVTAEQLSSLYMAVTSGGSVGPTPPTPAVSDLMLEITYSQLVTARNAGKLIPGMQYRITDYEFTTTTSNTSSANHSFDVIVVADDESTLNENARAVKHEGDAYFVDSDLRSWRLEYCVDNDTSRFAWADTTNGKGVIYRMVDEFGNDCPYDFKNCLFDGLGYLASAAYTFTRRVDGTNVDASIGGWNGLSSGCFNNVMKYALQSNSGTYVSPRILNFNVFVSSNSAFGCKNNYFDVNCKNNRFDYSCSNNRFGKYCNNNTFSWNCSDNVTGDDFYGNTLSEYCSWNTFGRACQNNTLHKNLRYNAFANSCQYIDTYPYVRNCSFESECSYITLMSSDSYSGEKYISNVTVSKGVKGTDTSNKKMISVSRNGSPIVVYTTDTQFMQV